MFMQRPIWPIWLILAAMLVCETTAAMAEDIALSLVHPLARIDIPVSAISRIDARATNTFVNIETKQPWTHRSPHVELCYSPEIQEKICQLTQQIVEQPVSIVVDCEIIFRPVIREPLCKRCLELSANDMLEANALAQKLKKGSNRRCAPVS